MKTTLLLGAHVSTAGGLITAIEEGTALNCTAIQIFTKNNRQWSYSTFSELDAATFKEAQKNSAIKIVVSHASYLINIGSPNLDVYQKSLHALAAELQRCHQLKIPFLVLHPGAFVAGTKDEAITQIAKSLDHVLEHNPGTTKILLENMAGQGTTIGSTFEELGAIYEQCKNKSKIGFCFDTCHACAAGYNLVSESAYNNVFAEFDRILSLKNLQVFHLNDSKKPCGSHLDRHEAIGKGALGLAVFKRIMNDKRFSHISKIIETPRTTLDDHAENLNVLRQLIAQQK
ncbi:TPA: deoxyribonuclease IV [Candidatus Dependentiae bacterium]|nr:deoxyribonuclease IV [Candidatus Dependentiae bacterium]